ncbi:hypothetical protein [Aliarcobacter vitoriensis]|uniref:Uncharacterized protein n=1 Tax=Aliarcobacter vitoriensis TaxID=2011099 RepID=A0A366MT38_9BACT|nr:hypothetical protein [Aliarcobacter vitoriensis]RBQ29421.1 hypothetical protein CRU91_04875 [Aliarcobacter vitoriensis]
MILKKFIIKDQKELYRHKNYLLSLDLEFDSHKKEYSNSGYLDFNTEYELVEFLKNGDFKYTITEEKITDFKKQIIAKYKTLQIDTNNIFIVEKNDNSKIYLLNQTKNQIQILDLKKSNFKSYKIDKDIQNETNLSIKVLKTLASNDNDFKELFNIFAILENQNSEELLFIDKLKKFKYFCISKIKEKQQDMFLCNCIEGFFPETKFYVKGDRVFSDYTNYFLSYEQEFKLWKYLYNNRNLIGVFKEPTLNQLFVGRKLYIIDEFENKIKVIIKSAKFSEDNQGIIISLSNGISIQKLSKIFTKEELQKRVIEARD